MGIFNRKLLVLLIFINCFNNIYIFSDNGVEVKEVGYLQSAKGSHQPIDSFINDYKSTEESDNENHINGDKNEIIVQNPTENSPIIKEEQSKITNWIKKNKILFSFLSIMTFIGGFFGIKSLIQRLFGKKNGREGDETEGGDEDNILDTPYNDKGEKQRREEQSMIEEDERIRMQEAAEAELKRKQLEAELKRKREAAEAQATELKRIQLEAEKAATELKRKQEATELKRKQEEAAKQRGIEVTLSKQNLHQNTGSRSQNLENHQHSEEVAQTQEKQDNNNEQTIKTINLFTEDTVTIVNRIEKNQHNSIETKQLFQQYSKKYLQDTLNFTLPTIESFDEVMTGNQESIKLLNTTFSITQDWKQWAEKDLDDKNKDLLNFYLNEDFSHLNTISQYLDEDNKIFYNAQNTMIILVEKNLSDKYIIKVVINTKNKFFISTSIFNSIRLHFNNFFFEIEANTSYSYLKKYQILQNPGQQKEYINTIDMYLQGEIQILKCNFFISKSEDSEATNIIDSQNFQHDAWKIQTHIINKCKKIKEQAKAEAEAKQKEKEEELKRIQLEAAERIKIEEAEAVKSKNNNNEKKIQTINLLKAITPEILKQINDETCAKDTEEFLSKYSKNLDLTLPIIESFDEVMKDNQASINLLNTHFSTLAWNIPKDWRLCKEQDLDEQDKGLLNFYNLSEHSSDKDFSNNILNTLKQNLFTSFYQEQKKMIILVNCYKIKAVINTKNKFFISISLSNEIMLHFNNFFFKMNPYSESLIKYSILDKSNKKKKYINTIDISFKNKSISLLEAFFDINNKNIFNPEAMEIQSHIINKYKEIKKQAGF